MKLILTAIALVAFYAVNIARSQTTSSVPLNTTISTLSGFNTLGVATGSYTISGDALRTTTLTITRPKECTLVVLEDLAEKIVFGCRKEVAR